MELKYRHPATFSNLKVLGFKKIEQKGSNPKIQLICVTEIVAGSGAKTKLKSADFAQEAEAFWKAKISYDDWRELKSRGLAKGVTIEVYAAVDNWSSRNDNGSVSTGTWFQILKFLKINYQSCDYSLIQALKSFDGEDSLDSLESEINDELGEFDVA
ncbi:MAG: hypothetical protein RID09_20355 [Coleofasciculus sp. G1-WW12-02]|uniref:hypothetical protein n=1 Tax=Coleofasciculus sp. G1-WW12-02 TaxID=3068483 RepID=UPI0032FC1E72